MSVKMKRTLWCWLALSPLIVTVLFPFAVMLFTALKPAQEIFVYPARWLPVHWQWSNFVDMWQAANFGVAMLTKISGFAPLICTTCESTVGELVSYELSTTISLLA